MKKTLLAVAMLLATTGMQALTSAPPANSEDQTRIRSMLTKPRPVYTNTGVVNPTRLRSGLKPAQPQSVSYVE